MLREVPPRSLLLGLVALACAPTGDHDAPMPAPFVTPLVTPVVAEVVAPPVVASASSDATVPDDLAQVREWLQTFRYRGWTPQTEIRATGEHGGERLYFNPTLARSMSSGASEHPIGSAAVRELYAGDLKTLKGFALMRKTGPSGIVGEGWFWYEIFGTTAAAEPTVSGPGVRDCVGCHAHAVDFVHSPATLREDPQPLL